MSIPFVRTSIRREVVDSTNDLAGQLAVEGHVEVPLVVRADRQTQGRGRGDHAWWSDAGSLTFTILLDPAAHGLRTEHEPRLALATALAVVEAILDVVAVKDLGIRWPNDVEAGGRKLGGILPERFETARGVRLAIGIGLNVQTNFDDAPPDVRRLAVSLAEFIKRPLGAEEVEHLFRVILDRFARNLERLAQDDPSLACLWSRFDLLRDRRVQVSLGPRVVEGWSCGIDQDGALCLAVEGQVERLFGGQVLRDG